MGFAVLDMGRGPRHIPFQVSALTACGNTTQRNTRPQVLRCLPFHTWEHHLVGDGKAARWEDGRKHPSCTCPVHQILLDPPNLISSPPSSSLNLPTLGAAIFPGSPCLK